MTNSVMIALEKLDFIRGRMSVINLIQDKIDDLIAEFQINDEPFHLESLMLTENLNLLTAQLENLDEELSAIRKAEKESVSKQLANN